MYMNRADLPGMIKNTLISGFACADERAIVNKFGDPESRSDVLRNLPALLETRFDLQCAFAQSLDEDPAVTEAIDDDASLMHVADIILTKIIEARVASANALLE